jgi:hypothetical protein
MRFERRMDSSKNHLLIDRKVMQRMAADDETLATPESVGRYSDVQAWVLIADPGAGKTDVFETLSQNEGGQYIKARDFVDMGMPETWTEPIFIDGLDEVTSGNAQGTTVIGQIRNKLLQLGTPKFRISCREADWRGSADSSALQRLVGEGSFLELHLLPLNRAESTALVAQWQGQGQDSAETFIREAESHDLAGLLDNPQTLSMLVKAMKSNGSVWPESKTQVYNIACNELAREFNDEHLASKQRNSPPIHDLHTAAGYLCAVMLLSSSSHAVLQRRNDASQSIMAVNEMLTSADSPTQAICQAALETRLFKGVGLGGFVPVHRTVAEYLGANYLNERIKASLPASRVLALMLGLDAGVVPELRGLHAWLAAIAPDTLRRELIDHDPLGVVLNGDVRDFTRAQKLYLIEALHKEAKRDPHFRRQNWTSKPFGALATKNMANDFKAWFQSPDRSLAHLALVDCLLDAVANGDDMPGLAQELELIVRDKSFLPELRKAALGILADYADRDKNYLIQIELLHDVFNNVVNDPEDEILGGLLFRLYPHNIPPSNIWHYLRRPKSQQEMRTYWSFWHNLPERTSDPFVIPILLDGLKTRGFQLNSQDDYLRLAAVVGKLLSAGVTSCGAQLDISRLYDWLSLGLGPHDDSPLQHQHQTIIGQWLTEHPSTFKALFEYGLSLKEADTDQTANAKLWRIDARLYGAKLPEDASDWYLRLAKASEGEDLRQGLVLRAFYAAKDRYSTNAALELLEKWLAENIADIHWIEEFLCCKYPPSEPEQKFIDSRKKSKERQAETKRETVKFFGKTLPSLTTESPNLGALAEIGNAYLKFYGGTEKETPRERMLALLNDDPEWVSLALEGLRRCLFRNDLPSTTDIIELKEKGKRYTLASPCLAAMALRFDEQPDSALDLPDTTLATLAAFRLTNDYNETPAWFNAMVKNRPDILSEVMQCLVSKQIASKQEHVDGLYALAHSRDYAEIAPCITPKLIDEFPHKASKNQLKNLRLLIAAMMNWLTPQIQLSLIEKKLAASTLDVAQHVYWLTTGTQVAPELYLQRTKEFVEKSQIRINYLYDMVNERQARHNFRVDLPAPSQAFLIGLLAPSCHPSSWRRSGIVTPKMELGRYVAELISALAAKPDEEASQSLSELAQRHDLKQWLETLNRAIYDQRIVQRKAQFKPASVDAVCKTLANLKPANAADLWALTVDYLTQLRNSIRNGSTNDYRQYWSGDTPELENDCRNALLSDLNLLVKRIGIAAESESRYADDKRADIKIISTPYHVPIEIKCENNPEVWTGISNQLIAKYGRDTHSDGYGIYLVFWFTGTFKGAAADGGAKPKTPQELESRLKATVPEALRQKIAVLVIDCSKPKLDIKPTAAPTPQPQTP